MNTATKLFFIILAIFWISSGTLYAQPEAVQTARNYYEENGSAILQAYRDYLTLPNVASDISNIRKNANYLVREFRKRGVQMELLEHPGKKNVPPIVYGELNTPGAERTLIIYVHYDGQPVDPANWTHNPWEPALYSGSMEHDGEPIPFPDEGESVNPDWRIYARSASDDKVPVPALLATLDALRESDLMLTSNLKFFFEGEEEAGSPNLRDYLEAYREKLQADLWLFLDGPKHQSGRPQVVFGVRGVTGLNVTVYGPARSLHSGHYGGWAPIPGQMLAELLASMKDDDGEILIDGFYDSTKAITDADRKAFETLPDYDDRIREELGLAWSEFDNRPLIESYMYPALNIKGMASGNVGAEARNVIPAEATASIGMRLAEGNDPETMQSLVEEHIRRQGYHIVREDPDLETRRAHKKIAKVIRSGGYPAMRTPIDQPMAQEIVEAIQRAGDEEVILYPTFGGSLPLYNFVEVLDTPLVIIPIANHDNNQHAPDENIRIGNIWYGMEIYSSIFTME